MELVYLQITSLVITLFIGLMLALSRVHASVISNRYELSRWMIVAAMFVLAIHFLLQIIYGFRANGDDVGAVVNVLFYTPVVFMLSFAIVNLSSGRKYLKRHIIFSIIGYSLILATFIAGVSFSKSLHLGVAFYLMVGEFIISIIYCVLNPFRESRRIRNEVESDTAGDLSVYNHFMYTGTMVLLVTTLLIPAMISSRIVLNIAGPLFLLSIFAYGVNFLCLGFNLRSVADVLEEQDARGCLTQNLAEMSDSVQSSIQKSLDSWIAKGGYANSDVTLSKLARYVGCQTSDLGHYISDVHGVTFRIWLSKIRVTEAKRMLVANPDATIEAVAEDCGFSSRSYFQNLFKAETGFTPREWRSNNVRS